MFIVSLLCVVSTGLICAGDETKKIAQSSSQHNTTKNSAVARWKKQSTALLNEQAKITNACALTVYIYRTAPKKNDSLATKIADKTTLCLSKKKLTKLLKTEDTMRRRKRTVQQHIEPQEQKTKHPATTKQRAKL